MRCVFFQAEDGIRDLVRSRGLGDVYKRQGDSLLFNGIYIKTNGTYLDTLINASNCDSIITLTLNIANIQGSITKKICMNDSCLLYTSDAADERSSVDLGGRRIIKKKKKEK